MDFSQTKRNMELAGINPDFGLPLSSFMRFPPGINPPSIGLMNQKRLKERFFRDNSSVNTKLHNFNQMYQKFASGLFEMAYPAISPSNPLFSSHDANVSLKSENDKLKKENLELKKQLEKSQKSKSKI